MMKTIKSIFITLLLLLCCSSCDEGSVGNLDNLFSNDDTVGALKEALTIGATTASTELGKEGGYLNDSLVRIALPQETNTLFDIIGQLQQSPAGNLLLNAVGISDNLENTMTTLINKAAEDAAPKAVNVFKTAITGITIADGESILFGANNAATTYLQNKTFTGLQSAFNPTITESLSNVSFGGYNANQAWEAVTTQYNKLMNAKESTAGNAAMVALQLADSDSYNKISSMQGLETNLADYVTDKALDGLFSKVANKELDIRTNAAARTSDLLKDVFGRLDK
ncbi:MAG: DUF4197 domain-containing protein [Paludibacteraceae bacterium]|nr:DUF4197 domain-containing protein [Paludibacteraceae bacterium]